PFSVLTPGMADSHLWLGLCGQKGLGKDKMKRSKKWNRLSDEEKQVYVKVAEGLLWQCISFSTPTILTISTLMGSIIQWGISNKLSAEDTVKEVGKKALGLDKVNALVSNDTKIAIAGFAKDGKGIIKIWDESV
ncbi:hypothetical protein BDP27DRAFT_1203320, partial [Rhodocollybia butyracea]